MEELLLTTLGIYLFSKIKSNSPMNVGNIPPQDGQGNEVQRNTIKDFEEKACPWFWFPWKRPEMFNKVPLSPGSRERWISSCDAWRSIRVLGSEIKFLQGIIVGDKMPKGFENAKEDIKAKKNQQAFLLGETKRLASVQMRTEEQYLKFLKNNFNENQINGFYAERKEEIQDRVWPKNETFVVPITEQTTNVTETVINTDAFEGITGAMMGYTKRTMNTVDFNRDAKRDAMPPGKRYTDGGDIYYEYRSNRSDDKGTV
tara:strand:+ start:1081 stop:1854 length:774 start_codon:yes stop_codon:yes gene_type:complete